MKETVIETSTNFYVSNLELGSLPPVFDPFGQGLAAWPSMASTLNGIENHVRAEFSFSTPSAPPSTYSFKQFGEHRI
jgi:hypothetical protein